MGVDLIGRVITATDRRAVYGAHVEISRVGKHTSLKTRRVITTRFGHFRFRIPDNELAALQGPALVTFRVLDAAGAEIAKLDGISVSSGHACELEIQVPSGVLSGAALPRQPGNLALISEDVFDIIRTAICKVSDHDQVQAYLTAADNFFCSLPPVFSLPDVIDIGEGVLRGRSQDFEPFKGLLDDFEAWNHRAYQYDRKQLGSREAADILSADSLRTLAEQAQAMSRTARRTVISTEPAIIVMTAAIRVAGSDPVQINRNIGIILEQFCPVERLTSLFDTAQLALTGEGSFGPLLLGKLRMFGGAPRGARTTFPPDHPPFPPAPFPCPGPSWPPVPGWLVRESFQLCSIYELIDDALERVQRRRSYSITGISPQRACPGDTITITGTGFVFEGHTGVVNFPGLEHGSYVASNTPVSWTDTEIQVVVPEGACDGSIDLDIPAGWIRSCGFEFELFVPAGAPVEFVGGSTQIVSFTAGVSPTSCLAPGQTVRLIWRACNTDSIRLLVTDQNGEVVEDRTLTGSSTGTLYTVPDYFTDNTRLTLELQVSSPCGSDSAQQRISVQRAPLRVRDPRVADPFVGGSFENFHRNIARGDIRVASPATLTDLVKAIEFAENEGQRVGVKGGACSYNDFIVPRATTNCMIDTDKLAKIDLHHGELRHVIPVALRPDLNDSDSVMSSDVLDAYREFITVSPIWERLVHVEAGIRFDRLVCLLEDVRKTMPTLGGGTRHSVTGAISTGTHGSTTRLPPIADFVRAIHLVGTGGQQWWLEPSSKPITDPRLMENLKAQGILDPCLNIRYRDDLFYAALVSFGTAGIFYSVIIETINEHRFAVETTRTSWRAAQSTLRAKVLDPATPADWFFDITMDPTGRARQSTLNLTNDPLREHPEPPSLVAGIINILLSVPWRLFLALPLYIARQMLRMLNPFRIPEIFREIAETIELLGEIVRLIWDLGRIFASRFSDEEIARAMPNILNLVWHIGSSIGVGRTIIDEIQNLMTDGERPAGTSVRRDHVALTFAPRGCPESGLPEPQDFSGTDPVERLVRGSEYAVPADDCIAFTNAILEEAAKPVREGPDALVLMINLRFTKATKALLGMQQFDRTCHVELFRIKDLNGNAEFERLLEPVLERFQAVPHWGQLHNPRTDFASRFGTRRWDGRTKLEVWQQSINVLASHGNTFRHAFALQRGLLTDL